MMEFDDEYDVFDDYDEYDEYDYDGEEMTGLYGSGAYMGSVLSSSSGGGGRGKRGGATAAGAGYGGDGNDRRKRTAGRNQAKKRETKTWKDWQVTLKTFSSSSKKKKNDQTDDGDGDVTPELLNTLKKTLRCQAPDWWWKQPQRSLYINALQVCVLLTKDFPKAWGDPEDDESAMSALEELAATSNLLVKQLGSTAASDEKKTSDEDTTKSTNASQWMSQQVKYPNKNTNDKDTSLLLGVLKIRDEAAAAVKKVLEAPECSMMGKDDYYKQKMRPLAFNTVESFQNPIHFYSPGGGHERDPYGRGGYTSYYGKTKKGSAQNTKKSNEEVIKSSAKDLWKELSTYPTSLPINYGSSIFVRAVENEMDKLRVLIVGPEDTPYANGCFIFDVSMGNNYPKAPPKVQFLTTSSFLSASDKRVRFNPNLYDCGKVCLSLLGTWSGPGWVSGESTLLQVLISLQSLILGTSDPYFNEPGFQSSEGTPHGKKQSESYNQNIRKQTLRVAILPFLQNQLRDGTTVASSPGSRKRDAPGKDATNTCYFAEFADVIEEHFKLKKQAIQKQLYDWLQKDKSLQELYSTYWDVCDQLGEEARKQAAVSSGTSRRQQKRPKVDAPAVKMKDGVILLDDDDDDEDLQKALANSMDTAGKGATKSKGKPKEDDSGVILLDSDDEETMNQKPAAVAKATTVDDDNSHSKRDPRNDEKKEASTAVAAAVASLPSRSESGKSDEVVDLT